MICMLIVFDRNFSDISQGPNKLTFQILLRNLDTDLESVFETNDWLQENTTMDIAVNSPEGGGLESEY